MNSKSTVFSRLNNIQWVDAFDENAPFYDSYVKTYGKALIEGRIDVLDSHRESLCYLMSEEVLGLVLYRLFEIAKDSPECSFIESLAFFLVSNREKTIRSIQNLNLNELDDLSTFIDFLVALYHEINENDLAQELIEIQSIIRPYINK